MQYNPAADPFHSPRVAEMALPVCRRLETADEKEREWLLPILQAFGPHAAPAVPKLIELLGRPDWERPAACVLADIGAGAIDAAPRLAERLQNGKWCGDVATALVLIGSVESVPVIQQAAERIDWDWLVEWVQVPFLERGRESWAATPVLLALAEQGVTAIFRGSLAASIGPTCPRGSAAPDALTRWLRSETDVHERERLASQLTEALRVEPDPKPEWLETLNSVAVPRWMIAVDSADEGFGVSCDHNPVTRGRPENLNCYDEIDRLIDGLSLLLQSGNFVELRTVFRVFRTLGVFAGRAVHPILDFARSTTNLRLRRMAFNALGAIGPAAAPAVPFLLETIRSNDSWPLYKRIKVIGEIGSFDAVEPLMEMLFQ